MSKQFRDAYRSYASQYVVIENEKRLEQNPSREGKDLLTSLEIVLNIKSCLFDPETLPLAVDDDTEIPDVHESRVGPWSASFIEKSGAWLALRFIHNRDVSKGPSISVILSEEKRLNA